MSDKMTKKKPLVPRLRFPEFRGAGEWEECLLEKAADFIRERIPYSDVTSENYISTENILPEFRGVAISSSLPTSGTVVSYQKYDILAANIRPYLKKIWLADKNGGASNDVIVIRAKKKTNHLFLSHLLINDRFIDYVMSGVKGLKMPRGELSLIREYPTPIPQGDEQQKIAACLSSLDELISFECKNMGSLKGHKKGLMQQLFPCKGETTSHLRFAEFETNDKWESAALHTISDVVRGGSPRPINDFITSTDKGINWLKIGDIDKDSKYVTKTSEKVIPQALSKTRVVHDGDLILSNSMSFGRPYIMRISSCIHDGWLAITKISSKVTKEYLYYYVLSPTSQDFFLTNAAGSGVLNLNIDIIKNLQIIFPHKSEQKKIADCLSSLDELIAAQGRKIELLKLQKKGLMQQLFPEMDEVTA